MRRVLITGSRGWTDRDTIDYALASELDLHGPLIVVHGGAPGADMLAGRWARWMKRTNPFVAEEEHAAEWEKVCGPTCWQHRRKRKSGTAYCPRQGNIRNQLMVDLGADVCLAFPMARSIGTWDCMRRARTAGIEIINYGEQE